MAVTLGLFTYNMYAVNYVRDLYSEEAPEAPKVKSTLLLLLFKSSVCYLFLQFRNSELLMCPDYFNEDPDPMVHYFDSDRDKTFISTRMRSCQWLKGTVSQDFPKWVFLN